MADGLDSPLTPPPPPVPWSKASAVEGFLLGFRAALAGVGAAVLARWLGLTYPVYAVVAAVMVTDPRPVTTRALALQRWMGTAFGSLMGAIASYFFGESLALMAAAILLGVLACFTAGYRDAARLAGFVAGIVVLDYNKDPWHYAGARCLETSVGILMALLVSVVIRYKPVRIQEALKATQGSPRSAGNPGL